MAPALEETKRLLLPGEFAWIVHRQTAAVTVLIGPDQFELVGDTEICYKPDPKNPMNIIPASTQNDAIQQFKTIWADEYAVIYNPTVNVPDDPSYPNGSWKPKRNESQPLSRGTKRIVVGPASFPVWPGQDVEIRKVHRLSTNEYLVAIVESRAVDEKSPYFDLTKKCAAIKKAVIDKTIASAEQIEPIINLSETPNETGENGQAEAESNEPPKKVDEQKPKAGTGDEDKPEEEVVFTPGQRIIITGTPTYVPPSGIEVLIEEIKEETPPDSTNDLEVINDRISRGILRIENLADLMENLGLDDAYFTRIEAGYKAERNRGNHKTPLFTSIEDNLSTSGIKKIADELRKNAIKPAPKDLAVRQAIVLGPTGYCILLDEDGKPDTKQGPGRIFPGPYDKFRTEGSDGGIYQAYHLRNDRSILLRIVVNISREELLMQLPVGAKLPENKPNFVKGDEIVIGGFDAYFVPSNSVEVINPGTRQPQVSAKHSEAYITAIGVDQKSGVYVADVETGNIKLVPGETKLLLDPRKQKQVQRKVPGTLWNLMIGRNEPHKSKSDRDIVETPWALSITVPNNEAVLIIGRNGRRPVVGPKTELLEYEETLEVLTLSTSTPKSDERLLSTCFLRVSGNRISDTVKLQTSDLVELEVTVSYGVTFTGDTPQEQAKWFNDKNYVQLLTNSLRSHLRAVARGYTLTNLYEILPDFIRDTILGKKEAGEHRPGHLFKENNMKVEEVEVLEIAICDSTVAASLATSNRKIVTLAINSKAEEADLEAARRTAEIEEAKSKINLQRIERIQTEQRAQALSEYALLTEATLREQTQSEQRQIFNTAQKKAAEEAETLLADIRRVRENTDATAKVKQEDESREAIATFRDRLAGIEKGLIEAHAKADVDRLGAIQTGLVEAIEGLGDKQVLAELANHLPTATGELGYLLGAGGMAGLLKMLENSPLAKTLATVGQNLTALERQANQEKAE